MKNRAKHVKIVEQRPRGFIRRFVRTALVLLIILYVAVLLISRTDGFRYIVEDRLNERVGAELSLGKAHMSPRLELVLRDLTGPDAAEDSGPAFRIGHATIRWSLRGIVQRGRTSRDRIVIEDAEFLFSRDAEGRWQPAAFARNAGVLAQWVGVDLPEAPARPPPRSEEPDRAAEEASTAMPRFSEVFRRETTFVLRNARVRWEEPAGNILAELSDVQLDVTPIHVPVRGMQHAWLGVGYGLMADGRSFHDLQVEMLVTDQQKILMGLKADWNSSRRKDRGVLVELTEEGVEDKAVDTESIRDALEEAVRGE